MKKLWIRIGAEIEIPDNFDLTDTKSGKIEDLLYERVKSGDYKLCGETYIPSFDDDEIFANPQMNGYTPEICF